MNQHDVIHFLSRVFIPSLIVGIILPCSGKSASPGTAVQAEADWKASHEIYASGMAAIPFLPFFDPDAWDEAQRKIESEDRALAEVAKTGPKGGDAIYREIYRSMRVRVYATSAPTSTFKRFVAEYRKACLAENNPMIEGVRGYLSEGIRQLAAACCLRGDEKASAELYEMEIARCRKAGLMAALGRTLDGYGSLFAVQGDLDRAERLYRESMAIRQKAGIADEARSWMLLAALDHVRGAGITSSDPLEHVKARLKVGQINFMTGTPAGDAEAELQNRKINAQTPVLELAFAFLAEGDYKTANNIMRFALTTEEAFPSQPSVSALPVYVISATCASAAGNRADATRLWLKQMDMIEELQPRDQWKKSYEQASLFGVRSLALGGSPEDLADHEVVADRMIARNGFAFFLGVEKRRRLAFGGNEAAKAVWQELMAKRVKLRDQQLADRFSTSAVSLDLMALEARFAETLGAKPSLPASPVKAVSAALPRGGAFVNYNATTRWIEKITVRKEWSATVVQPGRASVVVRCGPVNLVRAQIARYRQLANPVDGRLDDAALASASRALYDSVVAPVEKLISPEAHIVFICPDSSLAFIGLGALLNESEHFWCEKRDVRYVTGGRALLAPAQNPAIEKNLTVALIGDPQFVGDNKAADFIDPMEETREQYRRASERMKQNVPPKFRKQFEQGIEKSLQATAPSKLFKKLQKSTGKFSLEPLPGTRREILHLQKFFEKVGCKTVALFGAESTETEFRKLASSNIIHLATHGFYLEKIPSPLSTPAEALGAPPPIDQFGVYETPSSMPLMRSCLALAGAETTYKNWENGQFPKSESDGMLMADEVMDLDLSHTQLVTLSACETGLGVSLSDEGSVGVQRAFLLAGAKHVLATLWPISDAETVEFMEAFYKRVLAGEKPPAALTAVQRELLVRRREKQGFAQAIFLTAPFVLTSSEY
jgi:CHAT domain-containing protein